MTRSFEMIDVFGSGPVSGNPLAVVHDAGDLDTGEMLEITRWFNLSETAFLLDPTTPEADYRVRIFTLRGELPFAGHPTLGSCHAWLGRNEGSDTIVQECGAGLVRLRRTDTLAFAAPPLQRRGVLDDEHVRSVANVLGIDPGAVVAAEWVDNGPGWVGILLGSRDEVLDLTPDPSRWGSVGELDIGVAALHDRDGIDLEVRAFFSDDRGHLLEDPVTGSLNASLAQWLIGSGRIGSSYVAAQGTALGRRGRVLITTDPDGQVWVGGSTNTIVDGQLAL